MTKEHLIRWMTDKICRNHTSLDREEVKLFLCQLSPEERRAIKKLWNFVNRGKARQWRNAEKLRRMRLDKPSPELKAFVTQLINREVA